MIIHKSQGIRRPCHFCSASQSILSLSNFCSDIANKDLSVTHQTIEPSVWRSIVRLEWFLALRAWLSLYFCLSYSPSMLDGSSLSGVPPHGRNVRSISSSKLEDKRRELTTSLMHHMAQNPIKPKTPKIVKAMDGLKLEKTWKVDGDWKEGEQNQKSLQLRVKLTTYIPPATSKAHRSLTMQPQSSYLTRIKSLPRQAFPRIAMQQKRKTPSNANHKRQCLALFDNKQTTKNPSHPSLIQGLWTKRYNKNSDNHYLQTPLPGTPLPKILHLTRSSSLKRISHSD